MALLAVGAAAVDLTFDRFAGEVARINHEREEEHRNNNNMAKAMLTKGVALASELNKRGERRRMLQLREQELFAQWTTTQRKLELQAKGMMEELGESASFVADTRKSLDAAKSERSAQVARADEIDAQRHGLMERRRGLLQARALIAANLEELTGNMTVLDAAKQKALQAAVQQADAVAQEETQLASLEHDSSKERSELWNLDVRLHTLQSRLNQTLSQAEVLKGASGPPPVANANETGWVAYLRKRAAADETAAEETAAEPAAEANATTNATADDEEAAEETTAQPAAEANATANANAAEPAAEANASASATTNATANATNLVLQPSVAPPLDPEASAPAPGAGWRAVKRMVRGFPPSA